MPLQVILDAIADGVVVVDMDGLIRFLNPAAQRLFDRPRMELLGSPFGLPLIKDDPVEMDIVRPGGAVLTAEVRAVQIEWAGRPALLASLRDITERRRAEAVRAELMREQEARVHAEAALHERDEFLTVLNHEFRTPLTRLRLWVQRALRFAAANQPDADELLQALKQADLETDQLSRLLTHLLDLSQIERGTRKLHRAPTDLTELVQSSVKRAAAAQQQLHLHIPQEPVMALADWQACAQILDSMLSFALRCTPPDGTVEVALDSHHEQRPDGSRPEMAQISVSYRGRVIQNEDATPLFGRSFSSHSTGYASGLGVWLYVSRRLVEMHDGHLDVENPDGGTRVTVSIPRV